jgi:murein DD-endopeptidase MepM/ murein hydrolase activator NlpD
LLPHRPSSSLPGRFNVWPQQSWTDAIQSPRVIAILTVCSADAFAAGTRHIFPLPVTRSAIKNHAPNWCYNSEKNCHGSYPAADIFVARGTKVRAIVAGTVFSKTARATCGSGSPSLQIKGRDGRYYFYTHFAGGSLRVKVGNRVGVGEILGRVGGSRCASGTSPHLHIQMYGGPIYGDAQSVNIQPLLTRLFDKLRP